MHVAMKTGSSSIRGSCSTCSWKEKRRKKETKEFMIAEIFQANTILALCLCTSLHTKMQNFFCSVLPPNKKTKPGQAHCCGRLLYKWFAKVARRGTHHQAHFNIPSKCGLLPLTISYSSIPLQIEAVLRVGRLLVACFSKLHHQLNLVWLNVFHPNTPYNML